MTGVRALTPSFRVRRTWHRLLALIFPERTEYCIMCLRPNRVHQIEASRRELAPEGLEHVCLFCTQEASMHANQTYTRQVAVETAPPLFDGTLTVFCAMRYAGFVQSAIRHWKYDGSIELTPWFAAAMLQALLQGDSAQYDLIVPVLTSEDRMRKRGFDQAYVLALAIQKKLAIPCIPYVRRDFENANFTQSQTGKSAMERRGQTGNAYSLLSDATSLGGQRVLLVDDVVTTGATLSACTRLLAAAGARSVTGLTIAYVP